MAPTTSTSKESSFEKKRVVRRVETTKTTRHSSSTSSDGASLPLFVLATLMILMAASMCIPTIIQYRHRSHTSPIRVLDNVLNKETCSRLHQASTEFVGRKNVLFRWPLPHYKNYIEQVIDSILHKMYNPEKDSFVVEYWVRQEWHHTVAHADVDEPLLQKEGILRHPIKGHVLYLQRGSEVNGPTVVFPNITRGGELYSASSNDVEMLIVPFQAGRLLEFDGELLHAVPRPADLWVHPVSDELQHNPPSQYGRSVVLFNLWKEAPSGLEFSSESESMSETTTKDTSNDDSTVTLCNHKSQWKQAPVVNVWQESLWDVLIKTKRQFQLPLMGNEARRGTKDLTLQLEATELVEKALIASADDIRPKRVYLTVPTKKRVLESTAAEL